MKPSPVTVAYEAELSAAELNLGKALALIHHVLPRLDEPDHAVRVQIALRKAVLCLEQAQAAHARDTGVTVESPPPGAIDPVTIAVITAAVAATLGRSFELVAVQPVAAAGPPLNVWAMEGRSQIFMSHRVR